MNTHIFQRISELYGNPGDKVDFGIQALVGEFEFIQHISKGKNVWSLDEEKPTLYFNEHGVLAEFSARGGKENCIRIIPPNSLFWSESSFLLGAKTDSSMRCIKESRIYGISGMNVQQITAEYGLGYKLANNLTALDIKLYRSRTWDLSLLRPAERLKKALGENPSLLSFITRDELAGYLDLSRSTLFRVLNTWHHE